MDQNMLTIVLRLNLPNFAKLSMDAVMFCPNILLSKSIALFLSSLYKRKIKYRQKVPKLFFENVIS